jgi:hypothetical protein
MPPMIAPHRFVTRNLREGENAAHTRAGVQARGFRGSIGGGLIEVAQRATGASS